MKPAAGPPIFERIIDALGGTEALSRWRGVATRGTVVLDSGGAIKVCGFFETWYTRDGQLRRNLSTVGNLHFDTVFHPDRKRSWTLSHPQDKPIPMSDEEWQDLLAEAYYLSNCWLVGGPLKGQTKDIGPSADASEHHLEITPQAAGNRGSIARLTVDATTGLPRRLSYEAARRRGKSETALADHPTMKKLMHHTGDVFDESDDPRTGIEFSEWGSSAGLLFPHQVVSRRQAQTRTYRIDELNVAFETLNRKLFATPRRHADIDAVFPQGLTSITVPFELASNIVCIRVMINDQPMTFALDSGTSASIIDFSRCMELGLQTRCHFGGQMGGGSNATDIDVAEGLRMKIGDLQYHNHTVMVVDLAGLAHDDVGRQIDGVLGGTFMANVVTRIDYAKKEVTFTDLDAFKPRDDDGDAIDIVLGGGVPFVDVDLLAGSTPLKARLMVDTGTQLPLLLTTPFVARHQLITQCRPIIETRDFGLGGMIKLAMGRMAKASIGPISVDRPLVGLGQMKQGALGSNSFDGFLGAEILRRCVVTFDYARGKMYLRPEKAIKDPFIFNGSGMVIVTTEDSYESFEIAWVIDHSPAQEAGVQAGDRIKAVNGHSAREWTLNELDALVRVPGQDLALTLDRKGGSVAVDLVCRDLV